MWCREPFCISRKRCAIFTCKVTIIVRQDTPHHVTRVQICNGNGRSISVTDYVSLCETFAIGSSPNCLDQTVPLLWHMAVDKWCGWFTTPSPRINQEKSSKCAAYIVKRNTLHDIACQQFCPSDFLGGNIMSKMHQLLTVPCSTPFVSWFPQSLPVLYVVTIATNMTADACK